MAGAVAVAMLVFGFFDTWSLGDGHLFSSKFAAPAANTLADQKRDESIETQMAGLVDNAHSAAAEFREDFVTGHADRELGRAEFAGRGILMQRRVDFG